MIHPRIIHLDVTVRSADEVLALRAEVEQLKKQVQRAEIEMHQFALYAAENLRLYDDLRKAKEVMERAGLDTRFIRLPKLYKKE